MPKQQGPALPPDIAVSVARRDAFNNERLERVAMMYTPSTKLRKKHEAIRASLHFCKVCYYLREPRLAMQAFTSYTCKLCAAQLRHHNSNVPSYCPTCCALHELCGACGGSLLP